MNLYLIKILGIIIVTMCCIIATYTDVKFQTIPNKLTFSTLSIGITLVTLNNYIQGYRDIFYYFSVIIVFIFTYILWKVGVWAGGDVKLFTAISSLLIPEFLTVLPKIKIAGIVFPYDLMLFPVPTFLLIFNSVLSVIPLLLILVSAIIIKEKPYLIGRFRESFKFNEVFLALNSLIISYNIISQTNLYQSVLKIFLIFILMFLISAVLKNQKLLIVTSVLVIAHQIITSNIIFYLEDFIVISSFNIIRTFLKSGLISEALTYNVHITDLEEGMILKYPLYYNDTGYYFDKSSWYNIKDNKGELVCARSPAGITLTEIKILNETCSDSSIAIKKGVPFAPFILAGLFITLIFGNTFTLFTLLVG